MKEIKFCENNFSYGTDELVKQLKDEYKNVDVIVESCLGYCGDCADGPYALVDDELVKADTVDELYDIIKEQIEEK